MGTSLGANELNHTLFPPLCIGEYYGTLLELQIKILPCYFELFVILFADDNKQNYKYI